MQSLDKRPIPLPNVLANIIHEYLANDWIIEKQFQMGHHVLGIIDDDVYSMAWNEGKWVLRRNHDLLPLTVNVWTDNVERVNGNWLLVKGSCGFCVWNHISNKVQLLSSQFTDAVVYKNKVYFIKGECALYVCDPATNAQHLIRMMVQRLFVMGDYLSIYDTAGHSSLYGEKEEPQECERLYKWQNQLYKIGRQKLESDKILFCNIQ